MFFIIVCFYFDYLRRINCFARQKSILSASPGYSSKLNADPYCTQKRSKLTEKYGFSELGATSERPMRAKI